MIPSAGYLNRLGGPVALPLGRLCRIQIMELADRSTIRLSGYFLLQLTNAASRYKPESVCSHQIHGSRTGLPDPVFRENIMAKALRTVDVYLKPAQHPEPVLPMPPSADESRDFEQPNTVSVSAPDNVRRHIGTAAHDLAFRLNNFYSAARRHTIDSCDQLARRCQSVASRTAYRVRRTKEEQPLRLLGMMAGVAFAAGIAVRIWRSGHE
jgi:hypothetical protein